jgi:putative transcriptional regulator
MATQFLWLILATFIASQVARAGEIVPIQSEAKLAPGKFLVASRRLSDPNFSETVIFLIKYNGDEGAVGVIINRPTEVEVSRLLPEFKERKKQKDLVYLGGPVERNQMLLLARAKTPPQGAERISEGIYLISGRVVLQQTLHEAGVQFRAYVGYAGWAPSQLDIEISRGDWHIVSADAQTVFDKPATEIWPELIRKSEVQWANRQDRETDKKSLLILSHLKIGVSASNAKQSP